MRQKEIKNYLPKNDEQEENAKSTEKEEEDSQMLEVALAAISRMNQEDILCILTFLEDEAVELQAKPRKI
jgi:hypothetical protein